MLRLQDSSTQTEAFAHIVRQHQKRIYWYVRRLVIDFDDAKDVTQNVFIKAWENIGAFQYRSGIYTWLCRIATNESLNHLKKKCRQASVPLEQAGDYLVKTIENGQYISGEEIYLKLEKAVARLPEKQRIVFILRYFEEKSFSDIAEITDTSEGALHASYHHAVKKIESFLKAD